MKKLILYSIFIIFGISAYCQTLDSNPAQAPIKEKVFVPRFTLYKPFWLSWINTTAITDFEKPSTYKEKYGKISSFGFGAGLDARIYDNLTFFFDINSTNYKQELAQKDGDSITHFIGNGGVIDLPMGAKYKTQTIGSRLGVRYVHKKHNTLRPWYGLSYGLYMWQIEYSNYDETKVYAKDNGITSCFTWSLGLDIRIEQFLTFTLFFEGNSPVANYYIESLFGAGKYKKVDGHTYQPMRIGISLSDL